MRPSLKFTLWEPAGLKQPVWRIRALRPFSQSQVQEERPELVLIVE
jgi:hypothetical protein